jgi:hypothetical protein
LSLKEYYRHELSVVRRGVGLQIIRLHTGADNPPSVYIDNYYDSSGGFGAGKGRIESILYKKPLPPLNLGKR